MGTGIYLGPTTADRNAFSILDKRIDTRRILRLAIFERVHATNHIIVFDKRLSLLISLR